YVNSILFNYFNNFYTISINNIFIYLKNLLKYNIHISRLFNQLAYKIRYIKSLKKYSFFLVIYFFINIFK
ncbi:hypothetical protein K469DRAFT_592608, partial [Zopfia rhizophila CBS 207.26]